MLTRLQIDRIERGQAPESDRKPFSKQDLHRESRLQARAHAVLTLAGDRFARLHSAIERHDRR